MLLYIFAVVYLVVHHPAHVFEVAIIEKCRTVELHPQTQLLHTDGADFWKHIAAQAHTQNQLHCSLRATLKPQMSEKCSKFTDIFSEKLLWRWCPSCSLSPSSSPAAWRARGNPWRSKTIGQTWFIHGEHRYNSSLHSQNDTGLTSAIFFCILSSCSVLFCLIVFVLCTSYSFWVFSMLTLRLRATPARELSSFTA